MRISDWSSDVCSSDLAKHVLFGKHGGVGRGEAVVQRQHRQRRAAFLRCAKRFLPIVRQHNALQPMIGEQSLQPIARAFAVARSEEHTSELQSLMRISYAVFCLKKKKNTTTTKQSGQKAVKHTTS